jgi:hypothetical protein
MSDGICRVGITRRGRKIRISFDIVSVSDSKFHEEQ